MVGAPGTGVGITILIFGALSPGGLCRVAQGRHSGDLTGVLKAGRHLRSFAAVEAAGGFGCLDIPTEQKRLAGLSEPGTDWGLTEAGSGFKVALAARGRACNKSTQKVASPAMSTTGLATPEY